MRKKLSGDEIIALIDSFQTQVVPWCEENGFSLHRAFEESRQSEQEKYYVLSTLWGTPFGREYLRCYFRSKGGVLKKNKE